MGWAGHLALFGNKMNGYKVLVGYPERKTPLGIRRRGLEDIIKMGFREISWGGMDWIYLAEDSDQWRALSNTVMNNWVP
jgi:hypothetical protein